MRPTIIRLATRVAGCALFVLGIAGVDLRAQAGAPQGTGVIEGRVLDGASGDPLPGAKVVVTGSPGEASTDRDGAAASLPLMSAGLADRSTAVFAPVGRP